MLARGEYEMKSNIKDYKMKEFEFLFISPLYTSYNIETELIYKATDEILTEVTETRGPDILYSDLYYENNHFKFIKELVFSKTEEIKYCPICDKEEIIYIKGKDMPDELKDSLIDSHSYMWANEECEVAYDFAQEKWINRLKYFEKHYIDENRNFTITATCKKGHHLQSTFHLTDSYQLIKIGQYPSRIEFERFIKKYSKILTKKDYKELNTAIGLSSHGVGAGAFVYLRRVFERTIFDIFKKESENIQGVTLEQFKEKRMEEKIKTLNIHFGEDINKRILYDILSKGVHELDDNECKQHFSIVLSALLFILEKRLEKENKNKRIKEIKKSLADIHSNLK